MPHICDGTDPYNCVVCGEKFEKGDERKWDRSGPNVGEKSQRHGGECDAIYKARMKENAPAPTLPPGEYKAEDAVVLTPITATTPPVRPAKPPVGMVPAITDLMALAAAGVLRVTVEHHVYLHMGDAS